jgi:hypothetical protein
MTGHGGLRDDLERKVIDRSRKCVLHNSSELAARYSRSDLQLTPSRRELWGPVVVEAVTDWPLLHPMSLAARLSSSMKC